MTQMIVEQSPLPPEISQRMPVAPKPRRPLIRTWQAAGLTVVLVICLVGGLWWLRSHEFRGILLQSPEPAADFALTASTGSVAHLSDFRGKVVLLFFGYTACVDVCPLRLAELMQTMNLLGKKAENVQVLFVTIDPLHDTTERLRRYVTAFDPAFLGMTGSPAAINAITTQFGVFYDQPATTGSQAIGHTSTVTVIDKAGYVRLIFPSGLPPEEMAEDLSYLVGR
ncbi:MAG: SCO family protein [Chloroflexi bacterium]|nr:SCO family protein [Chloroflexota bacterium]